MRPAARLPGVRRIPPATARRRDDVVLFESWHGKVADSPRAISEELERRRLPVEQVWVAAPGTTAPPGAQTVRPDSAAYLRALGRAGVLITNNTMPGYYRPKAGVRYVQTWHGTPLKRIAFDIPSADFVDRTGYFRLLETDVARWTHLVSPNAFSTAVLRSAFRYDGEVLETGYPRNDLLARPDGAEQRERTRRALGVRPGRRVLLYAPTWRDGAEHRSALDLDALAAALGDGWVVLVRAHHLTASGPRGTGVRDVSAVDDVRELLLAADLLVTDYSSVMFDFAVTRRPMVFFADDLGEYRDRLRGFYFDFEQDAPGPLVATTDELVDAVRDLDATHAAFRPAYDRFVERFCHLDDGGAAARVVDALFGPAR